MKSNFRRYYLTLSKLLSLNKKTNNFARFLVLYNLQFSNN